MAPEVVRRKPTDQRLDIFAFGVSMYEMFAFELPWQRGTGDGLAAMSNGQTQPTSLEKHIPGIHPDISKAIHHCLEPNPEARTASMKQVLSAISHVGHERADHPSNQKRK
jgi:serine/threonine-protein kinase